MDGSWLMQIASEEKWTFVNNPQPRTCAQVTRTFNTHKDSMSWLTFLWCRLMPFLIADVKETLLEKWLCGAELRSFNFHFFLAVRLSGFNLSRLPGYDGKA